MELTNEQSDRLRVKFKTEPIGVLEAIDQKLSKNAHIELDNVLPGTINGRVLEFLTITAPTRSDLSSLFIEIERIDPVFIEPTSSVSNTFYILAFADRDEQRATATLLEHEAIPHQITVKNQIMTVVATVNSWQTLKTLAEAVESTQRRFELIGVTETNEISFPLAGNSIKYSLQGKLTAEQLRIIETAYRCGYFEVPQQATAEDVANELGIGQSTLSEQLRKAQNEVWKVLFGDRSRSLPPD